MSRMGFDENFIFAQYLSFKFFPCVGYNGRGFLDCGIRRKIFFPVWDTTEEIFLGCRIHRRTISGCFMTNFLLLYPIKQNFFSIVSHAETVFLPLYPNSAKESSAVYPTVQKVLV
jgi:hypothetical protein